MAADFTVIIAGGRRSDTRGRQQFGANPDRFREVLRAEYAHSFAGSHRDFVFECPGIMEPSPEAVLMFESRDVDHNRNVIQINRGDERGEEERPWTISPGTIPVSPNRDAWNGNVMVIAPGALEEDGNILHIESRNARGRGGGDIDDFLIDNVVVLYKTE